MITRRSFLQAAAGAAVVASSTGCRGARSPVGAELRILQASHPVAAFDEWFDGEFTRQWGIEHGVRVVVDHVALADLPAVVASEAAARRGHDLVGFLSPPSVYEADVIDHGEIVGEAERLLGPMSEVARRSAFNPATGKYFAFSDNWVPAPVLWRVDLWDGVGTTPATWFEVLGAAPRLKASGHPLGIGLSQDLDSNMALLSLMACFGGAIQDEQSRVVITGPETIEAVRFGAQLFRAGMTEEVFAWDATSNNRFLTAGRGSLIVNPISALRSAAQDRPELARRIAVGPIPQGPAGRHGLPGGVSLYAIWRFSRHQEEAKRFLVHLAAHAPEVARRSGLVNVPSFRQPASGLAALLDADPVLRSTGASAALTAAENWSVNIGHPGYANPAVADVLNRFLIPEMFATAARGRATAEEAVAQAGKRIEGIYRNWRARGRIM